MKIVIKMRKKTNNGKRPIKHGDRDCGAGEGGDQGAV